MTVRAPNSVCRLFEGSVIALCMMALVGIAPVVCVATVHSPTSGLAGYRDASELEHR